MKNKIYNRRPFTYLSLFLIMPAVAWFAFPTTNPRLQEIQSEESPALTSPSQTFIVTNTNGFGAGSLRQAILDANASPGADAINFNIPGAGVQSILTTTAFANITEPVLIDATTQPSYAGTPLIKLDGGGSNSKAFIVTAGGTTIKGFAFAEYSGSTSDFVITLGGGNNVMTGCTFGVGDTAHSAVAILIDGSNNNRIGGSTVAERNYLAQTRRILIRNGSTGNRVVGNWFGADTNGAPLSRTTGYAVRIEDSPGNFVGGFAGTTPGGICTGECNSIAGSDGVYIAGSGSTGNKISGNVIGLLADGMTVNQNAAHGVRITGAPNNIVGGTNAAERNVITGNPQVGVFIENATATGNVVSGNYIGVKTDGASTFSTSVTRGVVLTTGVTNARIGGLTAGERNIISGNNGSGVTIQNSSTNNLVQGNYIGTDATGMNRSTTNGSGVVIFNGSNNNTIGGTQGTTRGGACTGACNVISGNGVDGFGDGITIQSSNGNTIDGNYVGLNAAGTASILNGRTPNGATFNGNAVALYSSNNNVIGRLPNALPLAENCLTNANRTTPQTIYCVQDYIDGDSITFNTETGEYTVTFCRVNKPPLTGRGIIEQTPSEIKLKPETAFEAQVTATVDLTTFRGYGYVPYQNEDIFSHLLDITDIDVRSGSCACSQTGKEYHAGTTKIGDLGLASNNNQIGNFVSGATVSDLASLLVPLTNAPIYIDGNNNAIFNPYLVTENQSAVKIGGGTGNSVNGITTEQNQTNKQIEIANSNLIPPTVTWKRQDNGRISITVTVTGAPPQTRLRVRLQGTVSEYGGGDFHTYNFEIGHSFDETTDLFGTFTKKIEETDYSLAPIDSIQASVTVVSLSPIASQKHSAAEVEVLGSSSEMGPKAIVPKPSFDFDNDGKTDITVYRKGATAAAQSFWYVLQSSNNTFRAVQFGSGEDKIVPGDFNGDRKTDFAVWRPSNGFWYLSRSAGNPSTNFDSFQWGSATDVPLAGDFDDDGRNDLAVYRNGTWLIRQSLSGNLFAQQFGLPSDKPVPADYNGDGKKDVAVYRDGAWYISICPTCVLRAEQFGIASDKPVPADFDGDGKADLAVYRNGVWYIQRSTAGFFAAQFGLASDMPVPGDYDADGKADLAVFRPSEGNWYILKSSNNGFLAAHWGQNGDFPVPSAAFVSP